MNRHDFVNKASAGRNPKIYELKAFMERYAAVKDSYTFYKEESSRFPDVMKFIHAKVMSCKSLPHPTGPNEILLWVFLEFKDGNMLINMATVGGMPGPSSYYEPIIVPIKEYYE